MTIAARSTSSLSFPDRRVAMGWRPGRRPEFYLGHGQGTGRDPGGGLEGDAANFFVRLYCLGRTDRALNRRNPATRREAHSSSTATGPFAGRLRRCQEAVFVWKKNWSATSGGER